MLLRAWNALLRHRYHTPTGADELHRVRCADGVVVVVKRFRAVGRAQGKLPVLCIPGLGTDSSNFDAPAPYGLARVLADAGHDVFVVDLRGTGLSTLPFSRWVPVTFDDFVGLDLPAVNEHICATTGAARVLLLGHSMGGLAAYALLGSGAGARVAGVVTLCSPLGFPRGLDVAPFFRPLLPLSALTPGLFGGVLGRVVSPLFLRVHPPWIHHWVVRENIDAKVGRRIMYAALQDVPRGLMHQFQDWLEHDVVRSKDKTIDYRARLHGCRTPVLVVEAPQDGLADRLAVRRALSLLPNSELFIAGTEGGCAVDYGHVDVVFGRSAPADLHPRLIAWLGKHTAQRNESAQRKQARVVSLRVAA